MRELSIVCIQTSLLFLLLTYGQAAEANEPKRSRSATTGLFPFPRVGRGGHMSWEVNPEETHLEEKRQGLMAFPRVGKSMSKDWYIPQRFMQENYAVKRSDPNVNTGMWFGPRLGRIQKRHAPYVVLTFADDATEARQLDYTPRMGRELDEDMEYL